MEALSDMGATVVVSPSSDDRVDRFDQFAQTQRYFPPSEGPDLILESVHGLLCSWKRRTSSTVAVSGERWRNAAKRLQLLMWSLCSAIFSIRCLIVVIVSLA